MHKTINYINALPDFLAMQRVSFCWFINQGLTEELANNLAESISETVKEAVKEAFKESKTKI